MKKFGYMLRVDLDVKNARGQHFYHAKFQLNLH